MAVDGNDERESDSRFGGGDCDGKNRDDHAGRLRWFRTETPESDEVYVCGREHQLDPDQDENRVTPAERGEQTDGKQGRGQNEKNGERRSHAWGAHATRVLVSATRRNEVCSSERGRQKFASARSRLPAGESRALARGSAPRRWVVTVLP